MNRGRKHLILLALWGMDLSWLYGWTSLIMLTGFGLPFPQFPAIAISGSAVVLTSLFRYRGWRIYQLLCLHSICLFLACAAVIYGFEHPEVSFYNFTWLSEFLATSRSPIHWLQVLVTLFGCCILWFAGARLAYISLKYYTVSNHFDLGVIALILLHLTEMIIEKEGGIIIAGPLMPHTLLTFFAFSLPGFCLARNCGDGKSYFIDGFRNIGVVLSFLTLVLLLGGGIISLFLPYLAVAANGGVTVMKTVLAPVGNLLLSILIFLIRDNKHKPDAVPSSGPSADTLAQGIPGQQPEGWMLLLQKIVVFSVIGLGVLAVMILFVLLVWQLAWWLSKRTPKALPSSSPFELFYDLLKRIFLWFTLLISKLRSIWYHSTSPVQLYLALLTWGRFSGLPLTQSETPKEYGKRLSCRFPTISTEIQTIVLMHNDTIYGTQTNHPKKLKHAWSALKRLRSPRFWPVRLKSLLLR